MTEDTRKEVYLITLTQGWKRREISRYVNTVLVAEKRYHVRIGEGGGAPIDSCRNSIVKHFLQETKADFLLMIDDDQAIRHNPLDLVEHDLDVVAQPTPIFKPKENPDHPFCWNVWIEDEHGNHKRGVVQADRERFVEVASIGTGVMLIARRVLEHPDMRAPFLTTFDEDGLRAKGEDVTFCHRARAAGFKVWAAMDQMCGHIKEVDLLYCMTVLDEAKKRAGRGGYVAPSRALEDKRLIFCLSIGEDVEAYLARILDTIPGVTAYHEPEPSFHHVLEAIRENPVTSHGWWLDTKLPYIAAEECQVYIETSPLFVYFASSLLNLNIVPDIIDLSSSGEAADFRRVGARVVEITPRAIHHRAGFKWLVKELDLPEPDWKAYHQVAHEIKGEPMQLYNVEASDG